MDETKKEYDHKILWFLSYKRAKIGIKMCKIWPDFLAVFIDDKTYFKTHFSPKAFRPEDWLFPGRNQGEHISIKTIKNTLIKLRTRLNLNQNISAHTLRHCFATHALEDGIDPVFIQQMLGHKHLQTTVAYLHMTSKSLMGIKSPLDTGCDQEE